MSAECDCPCHSPNVVVTGVFSACCDRPGNQSIRPERGAE